VADFLLAWHNAAENGGWDPTDLWNVDAAIADDMLAVVRFIRESHSYPDARCETRRRCVGSMTNPSNRRMMTYTITLKRRAET
jgi:hypothetical protein